MNEPVNILIHSPVRTDSATGWKPDIHRAERKGKNAIKTVLLH